MSDKRFLVCKPFRGSLVDGATIVKCERCQAPVTAMHKNLCFGIEVICEECIRKLIAADPDEPVCVQSAAVLGTNQDVSPLLETLRDFLREHMANTDDFH